MRYAFGLGVLGGAASLAMLAGMASAGAVGTGEGVNDTPISQALASVDDDVRAYNDHLVTLASPYMQGRVPGSEGMDRARDYVEFWLRDAGLLPMFPDAAGEAFASYRDPFALGGEWKVKTENLGAVSPKGTASFTADEDFVLTGLGTGGEVVAPAVFVGYSIANGPDGYSSFAEGDDLTGKVAVMLRFEPMDEDGNSLWNDGGGWSNRAAFNGKLAAAAERGASAIVIINPPGSSDRRAEQLSRFSTGRPNVDVPVFMMSMDAGEKLAQQTMGKSLMDLRRWADGGNGIAEMGAAIALKAEAESEELMGYNVGGMIPGSGDLADEYIVIGAHMDHLGMGYFGSRSGPGELHPGADDNASGTAGLLLLAQMLERTLADREGDRRSILIIAFDGEESGLNGSRHYANDPIVPIEDHAIMVNWDMIGRIQNDRLTVAGLNTGEGLEEFLQPYFDASGLEIVAPENMSGASDHTSFYQKRMPVLFSIIADFHEDYHTPRDVSWKINRVGAVKTVRMYHDIVLSMAEREERFAFAGSSGRQARGGGGAGPAMGDIKVRVGVMPGSYEEGMVGIPLAGVTPDSPAEQGGLQAGDKLVRWDGQKITDVQSWMVLLARHEPGDVVRVGVERDGEEETLEITLIAR